LWKVFELLYNVTAGSGANTSVILGSANNQAFQLGATFYVLSNLNLFLAVFNALPAYPMDGGQAIYALVMWITLREKFAAGLVLTTGCLIVFELFFNRGSAFGLVSGGIGLGGGILTLCIAAWILMGSVQLYNRATSPMVFRPTPRQQAERQAKEAEKKVKTNKGFADFEQGRALLLDKNYPQAIKHFNQAIELEPKELTYRDYRAYTLAQMGDYEQALADYKMLLEKFPRRTDYYTARAEVYLKLGNCEQAQQDIQAALSLNSADGQALRLREQLAKTR
jgi:hypothetical protein